jgi:hypothetical protein
MQLQKYIEQLCIHSLVSGKHILIDDLIGNTVFYLSGSIQSIASHLFVTLTLDQRSI